MSRKLRQSLIILLVGFAAGVLAQESQVIKSQDQSAGSSSQSIVQSPGPEPRQITSGQSTGGISSQSQTGSQYPYNLYQNAVLSSAMPQTASSSGSWLSILRPSQGGRRASLTSRLRNIVGSIFRRDQSPYMAQGSSVSYSLRPPPSGFFGSLTSGLPSLSSVPGLGSSLSSGLGSSFGSGYSTGSLGSQQNLFASASGYQPIVIPSGSSAYGLSAGQLAQAGKWSSYKGVTNDEVADATGQLTSVYNPSANYNWATSGSSGVSSYPSSSYGTSYSAGSGSSAGSGAYQSSVSSPSAYQVAASSYNPSATYASSSYPSSGSSSSYPSSGSSSSYPSSGSSSYQRSSSSFKPIVSSSTGSTSYSSGLVGSSSVPSPSYASSSSTSNKPVQSTISVNSGTNSVSGSYSAQ